jgi:hypothetical protein
MRSMDIDKWVKRLEAQPSEHLDRRIDALLDSQPAVVPCSLWCRTVASRGARLALAAVVLLTLIAVAPLFNADHSNVWARVLENTREIGNYTFRWTTIERRPGTQDTQETTIYHIWKDHGMYIEGCTQGGRGHRLYMLYDSNTRTTVYPATKEYERYPSRESYGWDTPKEMAIWLLNGNYVELGKRTIDGRVCMGIESVREPNMLAAQGVVNWRSEVWFDAETMLPASIETSQVSTDPGVSCVIRQDRFEYGVEFPADLLDYRIPDDYTPTVVSGLRLFSELTGGKYPRQLEEGLIRHEVGDRAKVDSAIEAGSLPSGKYGYDSLERAAYFYRMVVLGGWEAGYFGGRVTAEDANRVLLYWNDPELGCQVVWGNLRMETLSKDELIDHCYAAEDCECLLHLLDKDDGTRIPLLADYLGRIGDSSTVPALLRHGDQWQAPPADNPFPAAVDAIREHLEQRNPSRTLVAGRLLYANGRSVTCGFIHYLETGGGMLSDPCGYFAFTVPSDDPRARHFAFATQAQTARLFSWTKEDRPTHLTVVLDWMSTIHGRVVNQDASPQASVAVGLCSHPGADPGPFWPYGKQTKTDAAGRFLFDQVPVGAPLELVVGRQNTGQSPVRVPLGEIEPDQERDVGDIVFGRSAE